MEEDIRVFFFNTTEMKVFFCQSLQLMRCFGYTGFVIIFSPENFSDNCLTDSAEPITIGCTLVLCFPAGNVFCGLDKKTFLAHPVSERGT